MFVVAVMAVMLIGATAVATEDAFADKKKKKYGQSHATSQSNYCGNDKMPMYVFCQNTGSQVQGEDNAVALSGAQQSGEDHKDKKDGDHDKDKKDGDHKDKDKKDGDHKDKDW